MLYTAFQGIADWLAPWQQSASWMSSLLNESYAKACNAGTRGAAWPAGSREMAAAGEVFARLRLTHERPSFGIEQIETGGRQVPVNERMVMQLPFGTLLHFEREDVAKAAGTDSLLPKVLIVAPLSGHFATLLTDTVRTMLADHDVYVTDWRNARSVPLSDGPFGLDEYVQHLITFIASIGPQTHLLAVCQPCVPVLAAVALMAQTDHPSQPKSMTLMAGPIDCRINATQVNQLATSHPIDWFESNLISQVPHQFAGAGRRVYPGFLQLTAFMSMNPDRHRQAFRDLYRHRANGNHEAADATANFYAEYFAVNDLAAEFYLETVEHVFQDYTLARGELTIAGQRIDTHAIRRTALFTVEGERDDICSIGQTVAAHDLCGGIKPYMKSHHVQLGVGHYGVFSGKRWRHQIYPRVREMIYSMN